MDKGWPGRIARQAGGSGLGSNCAAGRTLTHGSYRKLVQLADKG